MRCVVCVTIDSRYRFLLSITLLTLARYVFKLIQLQCLPEFDSACASWRRPGSPDDGTPSQLFDTSYAYAWASPPTGSSA